MKRRKILQLSGLAAGAPFLHQFGYTMSLKRNIKAFGKTYQYLKDPELRQKEIGNATLTVDDAEFSGEKFEGMEWRNIVFKNCDFVGGYEIGPATSVQVTYQDCRFAAILSYGVCTNVYFQRCAWTGRSVCVGEKGSKTTVFEDCRFEGPDSDPNHWGGAGTDGEARFLRCTAKWFNLRGATVLQIQDSDLSQVKVWTDSKGNSGPAFTSSEVLIEKCRLRGLFDMSATDLESLTIRDTQIDKLDLSTNATVKGDVLLERVQAECLLIALTRGAGSFTLRDSRVTGREDESIRVSAGSFKRVLIENVEFSDDIRRRAIIGGGFRPDDKEPQPVLTESVTFRNVKARVLRSGRLNTDELQVIGCTFTHAEFQESRIGRIEMRGNIISNSLNFTNTQAREQKIDLRAGGGLTGRADKLGGSNIRLQPR